MTFDSNDLLDRLRVLTSGNSPARWVVGFSGGIDSTVLLHALGNSTTTAPVFAVHINHGLHADAGHWQAHCQTFADNLGVGFSATSVVIAEKPENGPEADARQARYDAFAGIVQAGDCLLSAHHEDDQAETLLLNLMRGSGPAGLAGIGLQQSFGRGLLLRPLLGVSREAIEAYAALHQLDWIEDPSNEDSRFDRNFLRNEIMPALASRWPAVSNRLRRSAELVGESSELLNDLADLDLETLGKANKLSIDALQELTATRQRNVLRRAVRLCGLPPLPSTRTYQIINELLPARADAQPLVAWAGGCVRRYRGYLYVMASAPADADDLAGSLRPDEPALPLGRGLGELALSAGASAGIDPALAKSGLAVRFRDGGESIRIGENGPTKKLKKLLQEEGIVPWMRGSLPLLFAGEKLVAVADLWVDADMASRPGLSVIWTDRPALK